MHFKIAKSAQSYFNNIMNLEGSHAAEDKNKFIRCLTNLLPEKNFWMHSM